MINICIYEDQGYRRLEPLTFARPAYDLLLGLDTLFDKTYRYYDYANISLHCRPVLKSIVQKRYRNFLINEINTGAPCLFLNGRVVMTEGLFKRLYESKGQYDLMYTHRGEVVALYVQGANLDLMKSILKSIPDSKSLIRALRPTCVTKELDDIQILSNVWDLIALNDRVISSDFKSTALGGIVKGDLSSFTVIYNENDVYVGEGAEIEDFVIIDARKGPVFIDEGVKIQAGSRLEGPLYIGANSQILQGKISSSSIGPVCKVGGEVSNSILYQFVNKAHYGYLGHSYVGEWVNLGAGTTTSNLKGTYGKIRLRKGDEKIDTERVFLGSIIGDHVKTGIGTLLSAGTLIGYACHIFGAMLHSNWIPSFTWGEKNNYKQYRVDALIEVMQRVMKRRNVDLLENETQVIKKLYQDYFDDSIVQELFDDGQ